MKEIKCAKKVNNPRRFGLSLSLAGVKLKFVGECATMLHFENVRRRVGVEAALGCVADWCPV